jgi:deazaflavin-dependent oxidoreductase (nitroreductase family)
MALGRAVARFNRIVTNRITRPLAGRVPPFALVTHRGRRTGRAYRTPIFAFPCEGGFVVALTYGRGTDWERNVRAGGGTLAYRGASYRLGQPAAIDADAAGRCLPVCIRVALRVTRVRDVLELPAAPLA